MSAFALPSLNLFEADFYRYCKEIAENKCNRFPIWRISGIVFSVLIFSL
jgi:hypothetical protein